MSPTGALQELCRSSTGALQEFYRSFTRRRRPGEGQEEEEEAMRRHLFNFSTFGLQESRRRPGGKPGGRQEEARRRPGGGKEEAMRKPGGGQEDTILNFLEQLYNPPPLPS